MVGWIMYAGGSALFGWGAGQFAAAEVFQLGTASAAGVMALGAALAWFAKPISREVATKKTTRIWRTYKAK